MDKRRSCSERSPNAAAAIAAVMVMSAMTVGCNRNANEAAAEPPAANAAAAPSAPVADASTAKAAPGVLMRNDEDPGWFDRSFDPSRDKKNKVAVVFIHGIFGTTFGTWTNDKSKKSFADHLKAYPGVGEHVDSYAFGFPSGMLDGRSAFKVLEAADKLERTMSEKIIPHYNRIILVGHSMGGLVAMKYRLTLANDSPVFAARFPLIVSFGTPYLGSQISAMGKMALENPGLATMLPYRDNQWLEGLLSDWERLKKRGQAPAVVCAYEKAPTYGSIIVQKDSASALCGVSGDAIGNANHIEMVKPDRVEHDAVSLLAASLRPYLADASARIDTPDFEKSDIGLRFAMNTDAKTARIRNVGAVPFTYVIANIKGGSMYILPNEKVVLGKETEKLEVVISMSAVQEERSFRIQTDLFGDLLVYVDVDIKKLLADRAATNRLVIQDVSLKLKEIKQSGRIILDPSQALAEVASRRIVVSYPNASESARAILTADALSSIGLARASEFVLNDAVKRTPTSADMLNRHKVAMQQRNSGLDRMIYDASASHVADVKTSLQWIEFGSRTPAKHNYIAMADLLKVTPGLEGAGFRINAQVNMAGGNLEAAREAALMSAKFGRADEPFVTELKR